jgi:hypothetical protein
VPPHIDIKAGTVRQRLKQKSCKIGPGQKSPMQVIEPYIVTNFMQLSNMRIPISTLQGLQLCNSIVNGTRFKNEMQQFKKKHLRSAPDELGHGYWRGFLKRNAQFIKAKKAVRFDTKCAEWCTYLNMQEMYKEVYTALVASGLDVKHEERYWRNAAGEVVELEKDAVGCQSAYELIHPEWLVFVDAEGSNTSQAKDGNIGGETILCTKEGRPQQCAATKDAHFTMLGFTSANGEPITCALIFAAKAMKNEWTLGFDPFAAWIGEEEDIQGNMGEGKVYPMGLECTFKGKNIPCFCCCSKNGSITGNLLIEML